MYSGEYVPWDQYPKFLRFEEIQNPLGVVEEFFSGTWPKEHFQEFKEWRYYVVTAKPYKHRHGPGSLLFVSDELLRLLEACYLLSLSYSNYTVKHTDILTDEELEKGRTEWHYFPKNLSERELKNPYRVFKKTFKKICLAQYRDYLKEWLHAALYNNAIDQTMTAGEIIFVYDNLKKMASAAWVINQTETSDPLLKPEFTSTDKKDGAHIALGVEYDVKLDHPISGDLFAKPFNPQITPAEKMGLDEVVKVILKEISSVKFITYIGAISRPQTFYLVILIDDNEKTPEHTIANKIEDHCRQLVGIYAIVHKLQSAVNGINKQSRFWSEALKDGFNLYKTDGYYLPLIAEDLGKENHLLAVDNWDRWGKQGLGFLKGAARYIEEENYKLGLFLLHQAAESTLIGVIKVLCGYRSSGHNLAKLMKLTRLFTDELSDVFAIADEQSSEIFELLCSGYSEARYKEGFDPDPDLVKATLSKVKWLLQKSALICRQVLTG